MRWLHVITFGLSMAGCFITHTNERTDGSVVGVEDGSYHCGSTVCTSEQQCCLLCGGEGLCIGLAPLCPEVDCPRFCRSNSECGGGERCLRPPGSCGREGTCEAIPEGCFDDCPGVCGCDSNTYCNECEANRAGVTVESPGPCDITGECRSPAGCPSGVCIFDDLLCGRGSDAGRCFEPTGVCAEDAAAVCGCDGEPYTSACAARTVGGVDVASAVTCRVEAIDLACRRLCAMAPRCGGGDVECDETCATVLSTCSPEEALAAWRCSLLASCDEVEACAVSVACVLPPPPG